jgi:hypothetical protein
MIVSSKSLEVAATALRDQGREIGTTSNGVLVTAAQLDRAARVLRELPPSVCNGIRAELPGFIESESQYRPDRLVFEVGILPARSYVIDRDGSLIEGERSHGE